jgi:CheY-like chemotaxis protein
MPTRYREHAGEEPNVRVLVVSEDPLERERAASALSLRADVDLETGSSAGDLRRRILEDRAEFDVLVVDGDLRPRGGYEAVYDLRARAELAGLSLPPAVILIERPQDRWLADWAGAAGVHTKPVDPFGLADQVHALAAAGESTPAVPV